MAVIAWLRGSLLVFYLKNLSCSDLRKVRHGSVRGTEPSAKLRMLGMQQPKVQMCHEIRTEPGSKCVSCGWLQSSKLDHSTRATNKSRLNKSFELMSFIKCGQKECSMLHVSVPISSRAESLGTILSAPVTKRRDSLHGHQICECRLLSSPFINANL